jgi:N-acyl-D-aspartate/D-glutamate deacylase
MADLVIRGGTVVDGTGARAPYPADIAIEGDRIVAVGRVETKGRREIDADGLLVTPGFVDLHTHFDGQATWDPVLAPSSLHGVTTVAMGNCGVGFAPARPDTHDWLIGLLEGVEDIPGTALAEGLTWGWESFPEYLDALEGMERTIDVAAHMPHSALRAYVMGEDGADAQRHPDEAQIETMARLVSEALDAGAIGFATSRTEVHRSKAGNQIGTLRSGAAELLAIARAMRAHGSGVIQLISDMYQTPDDDFAESELALIEAIAVAAGRPLSFTVQQSSAAPDRWRYLFDRVARWRTEQALDVKAQVAPRPIGVLLGLDATMNPFMVCPSYRQIADLPTADRARAMGEAELRRRILAEHAELVDNPRNAARRPVLAGFDRMFVLEDPMDYDFDGAKSIGARAGRAGRDPVEVVYDTLLLGSGSQLIYVPFFNFVHGNLDDVRAMITTPFAMFGLSDAGAHCGTICDASSTTSYLTVWARDRAEDGRIPIEQVVHQLTQRTAAHAGWHDRGVLAPGYLADLNVIDFASSTTCRRAVAALCRTRLATVRRSSPVCRRSSTACTPANCRGHLSAERVRPERQPPRRKPGARVLKTSVAKSDPSLVASQRFPPFETVTASFHPPMSMIFSPIARITWPDT